MSSTYTYLGDDSGQLEAPATYECMWGDLTQLNCDHLTSAVSVSQRPYLLHKQSEHTGSLKDISLTMRFT